MHTLSHPTPEPDPPPLVLSIDQTAHVLGVSKMTIYGLLRSGQLTRLKIGHRSLIRRCEIDRFLRDADTHYPTAAAAADGGRHE